MRMLKQVTGRRDDSVRLPSPGQTCTIHAFVFFSIFCFTAKQPLIKFCISSLIKTILSVTGEFFINEPQPTAVTSLQCAGEDNYSLESVVEHNH